MKHRASTLVLAVLTGLLLLASLQSGRAQFTFETNSGAITITGYTGSGGDVDIPSETNGCPVTAIGANSFWVNTAVTSVTIPNSIISIGDSAFHGCSGLTSVTIPDNVTSIGAYAFGSCCGLTNIAVNPANPSYTSASGVLFNKTMTTLIQYPIGLTGSYSIPDSVISIGEYGFAYCANLRQAYFEGDAPSVNGGAGSADSTVFYSGSGTVYYLPGTVGWGATFGCWPTAMWHQPQPEILGSGLGVQSNGFKFTISWATNTSVVVFASTDLRNWTPISTNTLVDGTSTFVDSARTNYLQRFYRVRSQ